MPRRMGAIDIRRRADGTVELGKADLVIGVSLGVLSEADPQYLRFEDCLLVFAGDELDGSTRRLKYRVVDFEPGGSADEGGFLICEQVA